MGIYLLGAGPIADGIAGGVVLALLWGTFWDLELAHDVREVLERRLPLVSGAATAPSR